MAAINKGWMSFVDGENLTLRAQELAAKQSFDITDQGVFPFYKPNVYFWPDIGVNLHWFPKVVHTADPAQRCYYYTTTGGGREAADLVHDELMRHGFSPIVVHRSSNQKKAKGVDIALTKDMLLQAFLNNYDVAVLVAGDGDYQPLVEEVKRLGKWVVVSFFSEEDGLNPRLRRAADQFAPLNLLGKSGKIPRPCSAPQRRTQLYLDIDPSLKERLRRLGQQREIARKIGDEVIAAITQYVEAEEAKLGLPPLGES
jgi:uncharacterized LabA/DUF88 family protein